MARWGGLQPACLLFQRRRGRGEVFIALGGPEGFLGRTCCSLSRGERSSHLAARSAMPDWMASCSRLAIGLSLYRRRVGG